jgi:tRNA A-37 threonylcarbamoyl transferase component Bud32
VLEAGHLAAIQEVAAGIWPLPIELETTEAGLFNQVFKVSSIEGTGYIKRFVDQAISGNFPPLPTTAMQRYLVAIEWHRLALRAARLCRTVEVPEILGLYPKLKVVVMSSVTGDSLHGILTQPPRVEQCLPSLIDWLAALHSLETPPCGPLTEATKAFKAFKIELQYSRLLPQLPQEKRDAAASFVRQYLDCEAEPVHGDINSRNVLTGGLSVAVIDFEQGHLGEGIYDLAYIVSEYVIRELSRDVTPEPFIEEAWERYAEARKTADSLASHARFRVHLGFQTLYRLIGPSRAVWTGHLNMTQCAHVRDWSTRQVSHWLT